jgi:hypothetical protein
MRDSNHDHGTLPGHTEQKLDGTLSQTFLDLYSVTAA